MILKYCFRRQGDKKSLFIDINIFNIQLSYKKNY